MKKLVIGAAVATALFAPQAFAQAKNFQGFGVAAAFNITNSTAEYNNSVSGSSGNVEVQAQYAFSLGEKFVLGVGGSAGVTDYSIASNGKMKNTTSFFVTPGYAISDTMLVYGKAGTINGSFAIDSGPTIDMTGTSFGVGVKSLINKNLFGLAEVVSNQYADKVASTGVNAKSKTVNVTFGIGYQF